MRLAGAVEQACWSIYDKTGICYGWHRDGVRLGERARCFCAASGGLCAQGGRANSRERASSLPDGENNEAVQEPAGISQRACRRTGGLWIAEQKLSRAQAAP